MQDTLRLRWVEGPSRGDVGNEMGLGCGGVRPGTVFVRIRSTRVTGPAVASRLLDRNRLREDQR
jgi:hypothetical protein